MLKAVALVEVWETENPTVARVNPFRLKQRSDSSIVARLFWYQRRALDYVSVVEWMVGLVE